MEMSPDTIPGHVLRCYAMPAHVRIHNGPRIDGGRDLWPGVSQFTVGELGRLLALRAQIMLRTYRLQDAGIAMLRESAECCAKVCT